MMDEDDAPSAKRELISDSRSASGVWALIEALSAPVCCECVRRERREPVSDYLI